MTVLLSTVLIGSENFLILFWPKFLLSSGKWLTTTTTAIYEHFKSSSLLLLFLTRFFWRVAAWSTFYLPYPWFHRRQIVTLHKWRWYLNNDAFISYWKLTFTWKSFVWNYKHEAKDVHSIVSIHIWAPFMQGLIFLMHWFSFFGVWHLQTADYRLQTP